MLRNLAVHEQCQNLDKHTADYLEVLDSLVNTRNDVELLIENGVLKNEFGDCDEACSVINSLRRCIYVNEENFFYENLSECLNIHCKKPWNKWKANLRQSYLNTPWAILSIIAAAFLIIHTVIQTVCALISL